tara:strand:+ start:67 stop:2460 length:2394 start_codon:yes stop_codon:yes gene_type:complete
VYKTQAPNKMKLNIKNKLDSHLIYILALLLLTFVFFIGFYNHKVPAHDIATAYYPFTEVLKISLFDYHDIWPLWIPYGFSGTPFLMKPEFGFDSIQGIMILLIPDTLIALKMSYVLAFFLSGLSMYILMNYLKVQRKFAFIASLVYILNGHVSSRLLPWGWLTTLGGYALMPLVFMFVMKSLREKNWIKNSVITGIIYAILFRFNPDMKIGIWLGLVLFFYFLFHVFSKFSKRKLFRSCMVYLLIVIIFFGLSAQRIIPNIDYLEVSSRGQTPWNRASSRQLKTPDMFNRLIEPIYKGMPKIQRAEGNGDHIGIIAFLLICFALFKKYKNKLVLFFSFTALLSIIIANNTFSFYYFLWKYIPFFDSLRYLDRSLFLFCFSASILAGIGAQEFVKHTKKHKKLIYLALVSLILLNLWTFNYSHFTEGSTKEWVDARQALENNHILQYLSKQPGIFRIQTWETRGIDWATDFYNIPLKLEHIYRYDSTWYVPYMNIYLGLANSHPSKLWGILNVKYITSTKEMDDITATEEIDVSGFKLIKKFENCSVCFPKVEPLKKAWGPYLYENEESLPRAFIASNSILVVGEWKSATEAIYGLILDGNLSSSSTVIIRGKRRINDYSLQELKRYTVVILERGSVDQNSRFTLEDYVNSGGILIPDITKNKNTISEEEVARLWNSLNNNTLIQIPDEDIIMHNFDKREIKLNKKYEGFLVISEKFSVFPGWTALADGNTKQILNTNAMISSVYLEGNENNIIFEYKPISYTIGLYITLITLILIIGYFSYKKIKAKNDTQHNNPGL